MRNRKAPGSQKGTTENQNKILTIRLSSVPTVKEGTSNLNISVTWTKIRTQDNVSHFYMSSCIVFDGTHRGLEHEQSHRQKEKTLYTFDMLLFRILKAICELRLRRWFVQFLHKNGVGEQ